LLQDSRPNSMVTFCLQLANFPEVSDMQNLPMIRHPH
jgi:hypothetical protein